MGARLLAGIVSFGVSLGVSFGVALALVACGELDTADRVHDLRLLAMRAEPPEQVLPVAFLPDGGVVAYPSPDGGAPRVPPLAPVTVTALVADPLGAGREVTYRFSTCAQLESDTRRCTEDSPRYRVLAEGAVTPSELGGEPSVTFTPSYALIGDIVRRDGLHGFGGINLPVQIEISAGEESVVGFKRVAFQFGPRPLPPPNQNPVFQGLDYNGATWAEDATPQFLATERPAREIPGTGTETDGGTQVGSNRVTPRVDPARFEEYDRPTFDGPPVHFIESWRYNFHATQGTFSPAATGGGGNATTGNDSSTASSWNTLPGQTTAGPMTVWVVVRDGRGGESWIARRALAPAARPAP
jgi:hypothetical protein